MQLRVKFPLNATQGTSTFQPQGKLSCPNSERAQETKLIIDSLTHIHAIEKNQPVNFVLRYRQIMPLYFPEGMEGASQITTGLPIRSQQAARLRNLKNK